MYIRRKVFSIIEDENGEETYLQKEFGWKEKLVRPVKAKIGKVRRKIADKLYESGSKDLKELAYNREKTLEKMNKGVRNKELRNKILKNEVPKAKSTVSFKSEVADKGGGGVNIKNQGARKGLQNPYFEYASKNDKKLIKKIVGKNKLSGIAVKKNTPVEIIAHEIGHAKGDTSTGLRKAIMENDPRNKLGYTGSIKNYGKRIVKKDDLFFDEGGKVTFKDSVKNLKKTIKNSVGIISEEAAASLSALKDMKRAGATPDELKRAAKTLMTAGGTYVKAAKGSTKSSLGRVFDIASRRSSDGRTIM